MRTQNGEMFSGKTFDDNNNLEILKKSLVDSNKHPLDTYNIWKRSLVDTKWKRSWIRSNLSDGARQRFIIPTFSKISPVFFFSLGIFLSPSVKIFFKLNWTNCDEFISSGNHLGSTGGHWETVNGSFSILLWKCISSATFISDGIFVHIKNRIADLKVDWFAKEIAWISTKS